MKINNKILLFGIILFLLLLLFWYFKHPSQVKMYFLLLFYISIYFIPTFIALKTQHKYTLQIFILNFFLGITLFGWVGALIWATISNKSNINKPTLNFLISIFLIYNLLYIGGFILYNCINPIITEKNNKIQTENLKNLKNERTTILNETKKNINILLNSKNYSNNDVEKSMAFIEKNYPYQYEMIKYDLIYYGYISNEVIEQMTNSLLEKETIYLNELQDSLNAKLAREQLVLKIIDPLKLTQSK